jgi:hypothetical protein
VYIYYIYIYTDVVDGIDFFFFGRIAITYIRVEREVEKERERERKRESEGDAQIQ